MIWEKEYVIPYIKSLPRETVKVLNSIQIISDHSEEKEKAIVRFAVNGELIKKSADIKLSDDTTEPYVTYVINDTDFGIHRDFTDQYEKGAIWFVTLHLPKDYQIEN